MIKWVIEQIVGMAVLLTGMAVGWTVCVIGLGLLGVL